jgi:hypothetical protein
MFGLRVQVLLSTGAPQWRPWWRLLSANCGTSKPSGRSLPGAPRGAGPGRDRYLLVPRGVSRAERRPRRCARSQRLGLGLSVCQRTGAAGPRRYHVRRHTTGEFNQRGGVNERRASELAASLSLMEGRQCPKRQRRSATGVRGGKHTPGRRHLVNRAGPLTKAQTRPSDPDLGARGAWT